ncbi:hypothetical protein CHLNCDRAFT_59546 [Chlorella variabilis]|uniref:carbonic anhydrase n=1 Tax=Chlorella variabilis TaxID=554065 RepID=E1Z3D4_CHLVA|nr:hypothetical protein CHLNCDRAFT_59546 [Chlorella variabilis]EFN59824.1 hypothetical protein CHLNCDRAFT_59546 [Chlorella variabilis]|eukprot:XP_005851926.1 hypothetical protein CHLNCDRAFT_59546 [Chlorella variabilis]
MKALALLLALATVPRALACGFTYTHSGGLAPHSHGRRLHQVPSNFVSGDTQNFEADVDDFEDNSCDWNHVEAGRDWPALDGRCEWSCAGDSQSPINVPSEADAELDDTHTANLEFGTATDMRVLNLGHAIQVEFSAPTNGNASVVVAGDSIYTLYNSSDPNSDTVTRFSVEPLQFHFHATSEHMVDRRSTLLELHLVTKLVATPGATLPQECPEGSDELCLAVFGVLYDLEPGAYPTTGDPTVQKIIDNLPTCKEAGPECVKTVPGWELDLSSFFPDTTYRAYTGSLTTPPCSEGVMWHVFPKVQAVLSEQQAIDLQLALSTASVHGDHVSNRLNNRVLTPRYDRNVFASS